jgi:RND superfamily putative drug exporter
MVLVPAAMALLGNANWWLPGWLDRVLPRLDAEGEPVAVGGSVVASLPVGTGSFRNG